MCLLYLLGFYDSFTVNYFERGSGEKMSLGTYVNQENKIKKLMVPVLISSLRVVADKIYNVEQAVGHVLHQMKETKKICLERKHSQFP